MQGEIREKSVAFVIRVSKTEGKTDRFHAQICDGAISQAAKKSQSSPWKTEWQKSG